MFPVSAIKSAYFQLRRTRRHMLSPDSGQSHKADTSKKSRCSGYNY